MDTKELNPLIVATRPGNAKGGLDEHIAFYLLATHLVNLAAEVRDMPRPDMGHVTERITTLERHNEALRAIVESIQAVHHAEAEAILDPVPRAPVQWEYLMYRDDETDLDIVALGRAFDKLGADGWEFSEDLGHCYVFKRPRRLPLQGR